MSSAGSVEVSAPSSAGTLSLLTAVALVMGSIVGTGIFTLPSAVAQYGMVGLVGFVAATAGAIALALIFASLSRRIPAQGSPYAYASPCPARRAS